MLRVYKQCERTKKMLTANIESPFNLECIMNDVDVKGSISRDQFEALSAPLLEQILTPVRECLALTGVDPKEVRSTHPLLLRTHTLCFMIHRNKFNIFMMIQQH